MKLKKVSYRLFKSDTAVLDANPQSLFHEIDGEVILESYNGNSIFISWNDGRVAEGFGYEVACKDVSFFNADDMALRDISDHFIWKDLINKEVKLAHVDDEKYILEIKSDSKLIYCSTYEKNYFGVDVIHISNTIPKGID